MTAYNPDALPAAVRSYTDGHHLRDFDLAMAGMTDATVVIDDGKTYVGRTAIRAWLERSSDEWEYTEEYVSQEQTSESTWTLVNHIEGNFPGGVVDLRYQFVLARDHLTALTIEP